MDLRNPKRIVLKLGTRLVAGADEGVNTELLDDLGRQAARLLARRRRLIVVTSGAVHLGRRVLKRPQKREALAFRQAAAAIGQPELMRQYSQAFAAHGVVVAQVLLTMADIAERERYLHTRETFESLLRHGVVPIVNENDCVSEPSVTFGENDKLAAVIAAKVQADLLVFLLDQPGLYTGDPNEDPGAELIRVVQPTDVEFLKYAAGSGGPESMGGMATKCIAARIAVECATATAGSVTIDDGARRALLAPGGRSLLPTGVTGVEGEFAAGAVLAVRDSAGTEVARGITNFASTEIARVAGAHTNEVASILGRETAPEVIHRDNLVISPLVSPGQADDAEGPSRL
jgi:glutamate 5-kinase